MTGLKEEKKKKRQHELKKKIKKSIANIFVKSLAKKRIYVEDFK